MAAQHDVPRASWMTWSPWVPVRAVGSVMVGTDWPSCWGSARHPQHECLRECGRWRVEWDEGPVLGGNGRGLTLGQSSGGLGKAECGSDVGRFRVRAVKGAPGPPPFTQRADRRGVAV